MKMNRTIHSLVLGVLALGCAQAQKPHASEDVLMIRNILLRAYDRGNDSSLSVPERLKNGEEVRGMLRAYFQAVVAKTDLKVVPDDDTFDWGLIANLAGKDIEAQTLYDRFAKTSTDPIQVFQAQRISMSLGARRRDVDDVLRRLYELKPNRLREATSIADFVHQNLYEWEDKLSVEKRLEYLAYPEKFLDALEANPFYKGIPLDLPGEEPETLEAVLQEAAHARTWLYCKRAVLLNQQGKPNEAMKVLEDALATKYAEYPLHKRLLNMHQMRVGTMNTPFAELPVKATIGDYNNLKGMRGQSVVLYLFCHYHGPTMKGLKALSELQKEYAGQNVRFVGVTSYWGFFGNHEVKLTEAEELKALKGMLQKEGITLPVVITSLSNYEMTTGYGGLPQRLILREDGTMLVAHVGRDAVDEAKLRANLATLTKKKLL